MSPNSLVIGTPLGESRIRAQFGVTVLAYKRNNAGWQNADLKTVLEEGDTMLVSGPVVKAEAFGQLR